MGGDSFCCHALTWYTPRHTQMHARTHAHAHTYMHTHGSLYRTSPGSLLTLRLRAEADCGLSPGGTASWWESSCRRCTRTAPASTALKCLCALAMELCSKEGALQQGASPGAKACTQNQETVESKLSWHFLRKTTRLKKQ